MIGLFVRYHSEIDRPTLSLTKLNHARSVACQVQGQKLTLCDVDTVRRLEFRLPRWVLVTVRRVLWFYL